MEHLPIITSKEAEILKWHHAGKNHTWISDKFNISIPEIRTLILKTAKGYTIEGDNMEKVCSCISFKDNEIEESVAKIEEHIKEGKELSGIIYNEKDASESPCLRITGTNLTFSKGIIGALNEEQRTKYCPSTTDIDRPKVRERIEKMRELMKSSKKEDLSGTKKGIEDYIAYQKGQEAANHYIYQVKKGIIKPDELPENSYRKDTPPSWRSWNQGFEEEIMMKIKGLPREAQEFLKRFF